MTAELGFEFKLYYNAGSYESPDWTELKAVGDVNVPMAMDEADATTRGSEGFKQYLPSLADMGLETTLVWQPGDTNFDALRTRYFARSPVELYIANGDVATPGTEGLRVTMALFKFDSNQTMAERVTAAVSFKPTPADNAPAWYVVPVA